jgi:hypothetical protein
MRDVRDQHGLSDMWQILSGGAGSSLRFETDEDWDRAAALIVTLIHDACGGGRDPYLAERKSEGELARMLKVDASSYASSEGLEDALVERAAERIHAKLGAMSPEERRKFFEDAVRTLCDEDRIRLIDQFLQGYEAMDPDERKLFIKRLGAELGIETAKLEAAIAGGAAALIPLLIADQSGFAVFLLTTEIMYTAFSTFGITVPFAVYVLKNEALGFLLGPVGMLLTAALSAGWFFRGKAKKERRFRKLMQLIARASLWRDTHALVAR